MTNQKLTAVLNPEAQRTPASEGSGAGVQSWNMAPRLDSLNGKTVYLVNQGFGGSDLFMEQFQAWFAENMPSVKTEMIRWREPFEDDPDASEVIRANADAAILGAGI